MSFLKKAGSTGGAVFLSRLLGLLREQVFAYFFGAGLVTDAYLVAYRIPNLLRDLFAEGALSAAFVSVFSRITDLEERRRKAARVLVPLGAVSGVVCLALFLGAPALVRWMAPEFAAVPGKFELSVKLMRLFSPFLFFVTGAALAMGVLNTRDHFFVPSLGPAAFNLSSVVVGGGACYLLRSQGFVAMITGFTIGSVFGGLLQWLLQWPLLAREGFGPPEALRTVLREGSFLQSFGDKSLRSIAWLLIPSALAVAAVQINVFINTILAAALVQGSVSWMSYAYRLLYFPLGVFGVALSTAALPSLSVLRHEGRNEEFDETLRRALRLTWLLGIGSAAGLIAFRMPLVALLFEHGRFLRFDTRQTAMALTAFALALPALNSTKILVQAYQAIGEVRIPSLISLVLCVVHYFLARWGADRYGHVGLAYATALSSLLNAAALALPLRARGHRLMDRQSLQVLGGALVGAALLLALDFFGFAARLLKLKSSSPWGFVLATLLAIAFCGSLYLFIAATASRDSRLWFRALTRRLRGRGGVA